MDECLTTSTPLVSLIVPAYNSEEYLDECVKSIQSQTYSHLEIILVDDGSTDGTAALCDKWQAADSRVRVIHKSNGGPSEARNYGIDRAQGEYITFVDSDDILMPTFVEELVSICRKMNVAMSQCKSVITSQPEVRPIMNGPYKEERLSADTAIERTLYQAGIENAAGGNMYKRSLFEDIRFRCNSWYEDLDIFYLLMAAAGEIGLTDAPLYLYRQHSASFIHSFHPRRADVLDVTDRMCEWILAHKPQLIKSARTRRLSAHINILGLMAASGVKLPAVRRRCLDVIDAEGADWQPNPKAKRALNRAMKIHSLLGNFVLEQILKWGYKIKEKRITGR